MASPLRQRSSDAMRRFGAAFLRLRSAAAGGFNTGFQSRARHWLTLPVRGNLSWRLAIFTDAVPTFVLACNSAAVTDL